MNNHNLFHEIIVKGLRNNNHFILNPLHPNISMHILHTVLYIFPKLLTRRICLAKLASLVGGHFVYSCDLNVWFRADIVGRNKTLVTLRGKKVNEKSILLSIGHFKLTELFLFLSSAYDQTVNILSRKYGLEDCTSWQHTTAVFAPFLLEQIRNITITHET